MVLTRYFNTKYIIENFSGQLEKLFEELPKDEVTEIDIADARFTRATALIMSTAFDMKHIKVIDSMDPDRQNLIDWNMRISENQLLETAQLPMPEDPTNLVDYFKGLSREVVYTIDSLNKTLKLPLVVEMLMYRPTIKIDVTSILEELYRFVSTELFRSNPKGVIATTNTFRYMSLGGLIEFTTEVKDLREKFYVYGLGEKCWFDILKEVSVVPSYFGEVKISKDPNMSKAWSDVAEVCDTYLNNYNRVNNNTLANFIREGQ